jgi:hypothetical protein
MLDLPVEAVLQAFLRLVADRGDPMAASGPQLR